MAVALAVDSGLLRRAVAVLAGTLGLSALPSSASAQHLSLGVVTGGYPGRDFDNKYIAGSGYPFYPVVVQSDSGGYIVGPMLRARAWRGLSVGIEALYKPLHYKESATFSSSGEVIGFAPATVVTWQFPILVRYEFSVARVKPFIEGGPSFRTAGNLNASDPSRRGVSAGLGVETRWRWLRIAPVARYTRWADDPWSANVRTRRDQIEFLVGFSHLFGN